MERTLLIRIVLGIILFTGVFLFPYWLLIVLALLAAIFIPYYYEFLVLIVLEEMLYHSAGVATTGLLLPVLLFTVFALIEASRSIFRERVLRI